MASGPRPSRPPLGAPGQSHQHAAITVGAPGPLELGADQNLGADRLVLANLQRSLDGCFGVGANTHQARNITQSAGNAVANGMDWEDALKAITLAPAEMYGVDNEVGSIEVGKAADMVIWDADPLELTSYPEQVLIQGASIPMHSRQTLLRDRYLQTDTAKPPAFRN